MRLHPLRRLLRAPGRRRLRRHAFALRLLLALVGLALHAQRLLLLHRLLVRLEPRAADLLRVLLVQVAHAHGAARQLPHRPAGRCRPSALRLRLAGLRQHPVQRRAQPLAQLCRICIAQPGRRALQQRADGVLEAGLRLPRIVGHDAGGIVQHVPVQTRYAAQSGRHRRPHLPCIPGSIGAAAALLLRAAPLRPSPADDAAAAAARGFSTPSFCARRGPDCLQPAGWRRSVQRRLCDSGPGTGRLPPRSSLAPAAAVRAHRQRGAQLGAQLLHVPCARVFQEGTQRLLKCGVGLISVIHYQPRQELPHLRIQRRERRERRKGVGD
mmetsp:Transcript_28343/g.72865  ORF Transcript_28343/g.72865 Transcript_28343/m.72865 type:complete len:325 (+) Transcript_28343:614-1588(+)